MNNQVSSFGQGLSEISYNLAVRGYLKMKGRAKIFLIHKEQEPTEVTDFKDLYNHRFEGNNMFGFRIMEAEERHSN